MSAPITPELLRQRMAEDAAWFAACQAEIAEWRAECGEYLRDRAEAAARAREAAFPERFEAAFNAHSTQLGKPPMTEAERVVLHQIIRAALSASDAGEVG